MKNIELYRAGLSCSIAKRALDDGKEIPPGVSRSEYALYNLVCAVEDIALHLGKTKRRVAQKDDK
jgi:hypothetical protein